MFGPVAWQVIGMWKEAGKLKEQKISELHSQLAALQGQLQGAQVGVCELGGC